MPQVQMPDGQVVELPDKMTPELQNRLKAVQSKLAAGKAQPKEPEIPDQSPRTGMDNLGHQLGLGARYALEAGVSPVTGTMDAVSGFAKGASNIAGFGSGAEYMAKKAGMPPTQPFKTASATDTFSKGLTAMGFPEPESKQEKTAQTVAEVAPAVLGLGMLAKTGISALSESAKAGKIKQLTDLFTGAGVKNAAAKAEAAVAKESERAGESLKQAARKEQAGLVDEKFKVAESAKERERLQGLLDKPKAPTQSYGETGKIAESSLKSVIETNSKARTAAGNEAFKQVGIDAQAKEATGVHVDTSKTVDDLNKFYKNIEHLPDIGPKVKEMITTLSRENMTFAELEPTRRWFNDLAGRLKTEGFQSQTQKAAKDAAVSLDKAMADHTPSFKTYKEVWKEKSEPLDILQTKIGKILFDTEGSASGRQFSKTPDAKIPEKIFSSRENLNLYTEALAGGPKASPQAQAEASEAVQKMALKYFEEMVSNKPPGEFAKIMKDPSRKDVLKTLPNVTKTLGERAQSAERMTAKIKDLDAAGDAATSGLKTSKTGFQYREDAKKLLETRANLNEKMFQADTMAKQTSLKSQQKAVGMYMEVLKDAREAGKISNETFVAMNNVLDKIPQMQAKAAFTKQLAKTASYGLLGYAGYRGVDMASKMAH